MPAYKFTTLDFPSGNATDANGINNAGQIVGDYNDGSGSQGFLYSGGTFTTLNDPSIISPPIGSGQHYTIANSINASGQIAGYYNLGFSTGFLDTGGTYTPLNAGVSGNGGGTFAQGINDSGQVVGFDYSVITIPHVFFGKVVGFLYSSGTFTPLDDPSAIGNPNIGGFPSGTFAQGINNSGQIVGYYDGAGFNVHGFLYSGGTYATLDDPLATNGTFATGINSAGQIVGYYRQIGSGQPHAFIYSGGAYTTLDDPLGTDGTFATGINDAGQIVGYYLDSSGAHHGFIAQPPNPFANLTWNISLTADFNADGNSDLVWRRVSDGLVEIQYFNGSNAIGGGGIANSPFDASWNITGKGDFNGDGHTDLIWQRISDGLPEIQLLNGITAIGGGAIANSPFDSSWIIFGSGDFNGDGKSDLVWERSSDGLLEIQLLNGIVNAGGGVIANNPFDSTWHIFGGGDFNGDGKSDLIWQRNSDGLLEIQFLNNNVNAGGGVISNNPFDSSWTLAGTGDFNGDGKADLVWRRASDGLIEIQFLNGNTSIGGGTIANNPFDSSWTLAGVGDLNGDGKSDLVWRRISDGLTEFQFLNGNNAIGGGLAATSMGDSPFFPTSPPSSAGIAGGISGGGQDASQLVQAISSLPSYAPGSIGGSASPALPNDPSNQLLAPTGSANPGSVFHS